MFNWRTIRQLMALMEVAERTIGGMGNPPFEAVFRRLLIPSLRIANCVHVRLCRLGFQVPPPSWRIGGIDFELKTGKKPFICFELKTGKKPFICVRSKATSVDDADPGFFSALGMDCRTATTYALELSRAAIETADRSLEEVDAALRQRFKQAVSGRPLFPMGDMAEAVRQALGWLVAEVYMLRTVLSYLEAIDPLVFCILPGLFYPDIGSNAIFLNYFSFFGDKKWKKYGADKSTVRLTDWGPDDMAKICQDAVGEEHSITECMRGAVENLKEAATWIAYHRIQATSAMKIKTKRLKDSPPEAFIRDFLLGVFDAIRAAKILIYPAYDDAMLIKQALDALPSCLMQGGDFSWFWLASFLFRNGAFVPSIVRSDGAREEVFPFDPSEIERVVRRMSEDIERSKPEERIFLLLSLWRMFGEIAENGLRIALKFPDE